MKKNVKPDNKRISAFLLLLFLVISLGAGSIPVNAAAPLTSAQKQELVRVKDYSTEFLIDIKYATSDNFVQKTLYPSPVCVLSRGTLNKLITANNLVKKQGYRIKIWDAYRPLSVQKIMWEATPDKKYVANPYGVTGSNHNRGAAVDVTLVDRNGKEVNMPTGYDNFTAKAAPGYTGMSTEQRKNLNILTNAMRSAGFKTISTEWWHFDDTEWRSYKIQDLSLSHFDNTTYTLDGSTLTKLKFIQKYAPSQLIVVTSQQRNSSYAVISTYEKGKNGWVLVSKGIPGYIGRLGFTSNKTEGDQKTPIGAFRIGTCYGKASTVDTGLSYYQYDTKDVWVDDPASALYNTPQREPANGRWKSAEKFSSMKNGIYDVFFNIEYNTDRVKNKGSAIFFHIANKTMPIIYTSGCIATDKNNVLKIVKWLDKDKSPMILQGPLSEIVLY